MKKKRKGEKKTRVICPLCLEKKGKDGFYNTGGYCKDCQKNYNSKNAVEKRAKVLQHYIDIGKVKEEHRQAADRLLISAHSRHKACKYNQKGYENINCDYPEYLDFFEELYEEERIFSEWEKLTDYYYENGKKRNDTPVLDRIDEKGHYTISNIQANTHLGNTLRAVRKPMLFFLWQRSPIKEIISGRYNTIDELKNALKETDFDLNSSINTLANKARNIGEGDFVAREFTHNDKRYLVQMAYVN